MPKAILPGKSVIFFYSKNNISNLQVFVLMALFGGVYLPCLIGLLPDKTNDTYGRFFAMLYSYLEQNGLPNDFSGHFFMTDFERNIRDNFHLFWPNVKLLGCYFHFSQVRYSN